MNKFDLLTLAAKAAGKSESDYSRVYYDGEKWLELTGTIGCRSGTWNPFIDSDDAFELAAALQISILHFPACVEVEYPKIGLPTKLIGATGLFGDVSAGQSRASVARDLIVQAAANLGKYRN